MRQTPKASATRSSGQASGPSASARRKLWARVRVWAAWLPVRLRRWRLPAAVVLAIETYLIASWWDWQFGASYGHRGFVDFYPILAIGLAATFARIAAMPLLWRPALVVGTLFCGLSVFQMLQYWQGVLPMSDTTWTQYRAIFLRGWW